MGIFQNNACLVITCCFKSVSLYVSSFYSVDNLFAIFAHVKITKGLVICPVVAFIQSCFLICCFTICIECCFYRCRTNTILVITVVPYYLYRNFYGKWNMCILDCETCYSSCFISCLGCFCCILIFACRNSLYVDGILKFLTCFVFSKFFPFCLPFVGCIQSNFVANCLFGITINCRQLYGY